MQRAAAAGCDGVRRERVLGSAPSAAQLRQIPEAEGERRVGSSSSLYNHWMCQVLDRRPRHQCGEDDITVADLSDTTI